MAQSQTHVREMQECIDNCHDCSRICNETVAHCLQLGGKHAEAEHIKGLIACAEICRTSAAFMELGSNLHAETCSTCALACDACAQSCDRLAEGDAQMERCSEVCRRCAESCRRMANAR